jgi:hypothetical protein
VSSSTEAPRSSAAMWASAGYFASAPTTAPTSAPTTASTSHGHGRAVVGSSSSSGGIAYVSSAGVSSSSTHRGQARHAPLWARHGTLSAALLLKDSLCVVHLFEVARRIGTTLSSLPTTAPKPPGAVPGGTSRAVTGATTPLSNACGAEVARAVSGAMVAASVTPLVNFGRVHVSLLLRCVPPSARAVAGAEQEHAGAVAGAEQEHAARLSLRLLAQLLRHSLERPNGWQLLPLLHHLFHERANTPARTCSFSSAAASSPPTGRGAAQGGRAAALCRAARPGAQDGALRAQHGARLAQHSARRARRTQLARFAV